MDYVNGPRSLPFRSSASHQAGCHLPAAHSHLHVGSHVEWVTATETLANGMPGEAWERASAFLTHERDTAGAELICCGRPSGDCPRLSPQPAQPQMCTQSQTAEELLGQDQPQFLNCKLASEMNANGLKPLRSGWSVVQHLSGNRLTNT